MCGSVGVLVLFCVRCCVLLILGSLGWGRCTQCWVNEKDILDLNIHMIFGAISVKCLVSFFVFVYLFSLMLLHIVCSLLCPQFVGGQ